MKKTYSIKDLELISGIKAHTIRMWESRYQLIEPQRTPTNIRFYTDEDIKKLLNISAVLNNGMKISQAARLSEDELLSSVSDLEKLHNNYDAHSRRLKVAMMEYDEALMNNIINNCLIKYGTPETLDKILGPFIRQVGLLWQINAISVGHEHFVSNVLRAKLFSLLDHIGSTGNASTPGVILFLPANELHELSLLYLYYHFKRAGYRTLYLGQDVPLEYLREAADVFKPKYLVSVLTTQPHFEDVGFYFERINELFDLDKMTFLLTGIQLADKEIEVQNSGIELFEGVNELKTSFLRKSPA